ncbi:unnamed protein product [Pleuronectes platessa]|uniref:Uncharacterized protein n=1 Tax=Pleuronectes platessa TaxID=8262 RepID=A0A9N7W426_PLEPL|nr:unnamed protein product [Pleuronectes platessa]
MQLSQRVRVIWKKWQTAKEAMPTRSSGFHNLWMLLAQHKNYSGLRRNKNTWWSDVSPLQRPSAPRGGIKGSVSTGSEVNITGFFSALQPSRGWEETGKRLGRGWEGWETAGAAHSTCLKHVKCFQHDVRSIGRRGRGLFDGTPEQMLTQR